MRINSGEIHAVVNGKKNAYGKHNIFALVIKNIVNILGYAV